MGVNPVFDNESNLKKEVPFARDFFGRIFPQSRRDHPISPCTILNSSPLKALPTHTGALEVFPGGIYVSSEDSHRRRIFNAKMQK